MEKNDKKKLGHTLTEAYAKIYPHLTPSLQNKKPIEKTDNRLFEKQSVEEISE